MLRLRDVQADSRGVLGRLLMGPVKPTSLERGLGDVDMKNPGYQLRVSGPRWDKAS